MTKRRGNADLACRPPGRASQRGVARPPCSTLAGPGDWLSSPPLGSDGRVLAASSAWRSSTTRWQALVSLAADGGWWSFLGMTESGRFQVDCDAPLRHRRDELGLLVLTGVPVRPSANAAVALFGGQFLSFGAHRGVVPQ